MGHSEESGMPEGDSATVERIIANTINETARGDPDALASRIVAALAEAGYRILPASGRENGAPRPRRAETRQLYRSPNGDSWSLARDPARGTAFVRHQANAPSGGQVTDIELDAFLSGPRNPEQDALLRLIGASILDPQGAEAEVEPAAVNTGSKWSDGELNELGNMLVRGDLTSCTGRFVMPTTTESTSAGAPGMPPTRTATTIASSGLNPSDLTTLKGALAILRAARTDAKNIDPKAAGPAHAAHSGDCDRPFRPKVITDSGDRDHAVTRPIGSA
jgi:hypothetical protein